MNIISSTSAAQTSSENSHQVVVDFCAHLSMLSKRLRRRVCCCLATRERYPNLENNFLSTAVVVGSAVAATTWVA